MNQDIKRIIFKASYGNVKTPKMPQFFIDFRYSSEVKNRTDNYE